MTSRRSVLGAATVGGITLLAGCLEDILEGDLDEEAEPAGVPDSVLESTGFTHVGTESFEIDESFSIGDESIDLYALSWVAGYTLEDFDQSELEDEEDLGDIDNSETVGLAVVSTPSAEFAGQEVNPAGRFETDELIDQFDSELVEGGVESLTHVEDTPVEVLGESVDLSVFEAELSHDSVDGTFTIELFVTSVASGDDYVLPAGFYHHSLDYRDEIIELVEAIEHPVERPE